jgi:hypothetical protein
MPRVAPSPEISPAYTTGITPRSDRGRRWLRWLYYCLAASKWLCLLLWLLARIITDRTLVFQYLFWASGAILLLALIFGAASAITGHFAYVSKEARRSWLTRRHAFAISGITACTWFLMHDWHVLPAIRQAIFAPNPGQQQTLRLVHWNQSVFSSNNLKATTASLTQHGMPDIMLISMQNNVEQWRSINAHLRTRLGQPPVPLDDPSQPRTYGLPDGFHFTNYGMEKIWSRYPLLSIREFVVSMQDVPPPTTQPSGQPTSTPQPTVAIRQVHPVIRRGLEEIFQLTNSPFRPPERMEDATVTVVIFDSHAVLGRNLVIYWVDLPSNPLAWRHGITQRIASHIRKLQTLPTEQAQSLGLAIPPADVVIGDFNIPTFSASIDAILPPDPRGRFQHASQASVAISRLASWPRPLNALGLDHTLVAPDWHVSQYRLFDPAASEHMAQSMLIWPKPTTSAMPPAPSQPPTN